MCRTFQDPGGNGPGRWRWWEGKRGDELGVCSLVKRSMGAKRNDLESRMMHIVELLSLRGGRKKCVRSPQVTGTAVADCLSRDVC